MVTALQWVYFRPLHRPIGNLSHLGIIIIIKKIFCGLVINGFGNEIN